MKREEDAIRAVRAASNAAIAARDADRVVACMLDDVTVSVAHGPVLQGREASRAAFAAQFGDRAFVGYVREATDIVIDAVPMRATEVRATEVRATEVRATEVRATEVRATERGRWTGRWRHGTTEQVMRGTYEARWRHTEFGWFIESEVFTTSQNASALESQ